MDDDSCVLKYIEIVPLDNNAQQFEDVKPFQVKVFIVNLLPNLLYKLWITKYETWGWSMHHLLESIESMHQPMQYNCYCKSIHYFSCKFGKLRLEFTIVLELFLHFDARCHQVFDSGFQLF